MADDTQRREAAARLVAALQRRGEANAEWEQAKAEAREAGVTTGMALHAAAEARIFPDLVLELFDEYQQGS